MYSVSKAKLSISPSNSNERRACRSLAACLYVLLRFKKKGRMKGDKGDSPSIHPPPRLHSVEMCIQLRHCTERMSCMHRFMNVAESGGDLDLTK
ncbi:unnamed protein product [Leptosia nina]|uniref:Uncharacterized protein n=1 Tax=Leptosia nina TaxID=320188 RepID=A0AAV1K0Z0_9NEOP